MSFKVNTIYIRSVGLFLPLLFFFGAYAQLTPVKNTSLIATPVIVPEKYKDLLPSGLTVNIPQGYKATIFYTGRLSKGRFMSWGPDSVLHIANMNSGEVLALPDRNHDLVADTVVAAAKDAYGHDVKFYQGEMFVAEEKQIEKFSDGNKDGVFEKREVFIDSILEGKKRKPGGHTTRTMAFDPRHKKIYLSVGSSCNICREEGRAVIYEYDLKGDRQRIYASGTRNCIGMALHPVTGELWATNNGSDYINNSIPPEDIFRLQKNGYYGYPFAYGRRNYFDFSVHEDYQKILPITAADSALVSKMKFPAATIQAHSAPMAIQFSNNSFIKNFREGAFVALRGSFDTKPPAGYKVVFLKISADQKVKNIEDFISGFDQSPAGKAWARPVGLLADLRGNLYMSSDDLNQFILIVSPQK